MTFRTYDSTKDKAAAHRIWREAGWLEEDKENVMDAHVETGRAMVADLDGEAECLVLSVPGTIRYLDQELPFTGITGVTTSRVARKQGLARQLTARLIAADVADGALVAGLGMFEQGFYNQLGFGTGSYEHWMGFDPARLRVKVKARVPRRITTDDWAKVHASRLARLRLHGAISFTSPDMTRADMMSTKNKFGLGYFGPDGELTHHIWCRSTGEHGPYSVLWMSYQTREQLLELLALLKNLGDQVRLVRMCEPPAFQLQDLIAQPFKQGQISEKSKFETGSRAWAYWQMRICDLAGCMAHTHLDGDAVRFNLDLHDPIERFLDESAPFHGISGSYVVTLGPTSAAEPGTDDALDTLRASVGAFTRMWLGVCPATGLSATDVLAGPPALLDRLDRVLRLPAPHVDWDF
jgi:GNAT acetyltransferase-like protein